MGAEGAVSVKKYHDRSGYVMEGVRIDGKRVRKFFKNEGAATTYAQQKNTEILNHGLKALSLPDDARIMASEAVALLAPHGKTIRDAIAHYIKYLETAEKSCRMGDLIA